jgi:hypothetical protein
MIYGSSRVVLDGTADYLGNILGSTGHFINPVTFVAQPAGSHVVSALNFNGYDKYVASCSYPIGGTECSISSKEAFSKTNLTTNSSYSSFPISVTNGYVTKVVFMYVDPNAVTETVQSGWGAIMVKRVTETLSTLAGTRSAVDSTDLVSSTNPQYWGQAYSAGTHTVYVTDLSDYDESVGVCSYNIGSPECLVNHDYLYSSASVTCGNGVCSAPVSVSANKVTKVVFRYIRKIILTPTTPTIPTTPQTPVTPVVPPTSVVMPTATISVSPSTVTTGQTATVSWSSTNATACTGTGFRTNNAVSGSQQVKFTSPTTVTYSLSCTNNSGGIRTSATLTVTGQTTTPTTPTTPVVQAPNPPVITSLSYPSCNVGGSYGCRLEIRGTGFTTSGNTVKVGNTVVGINNTSYGNILLGYNNSLVVDIPPTMSPGTYTITVSNTNGTSNAYGPFTLNDVTTFVPRVTSVSPSSGPLGTTVTLTGRNFSKSGTNTIQFGPFWLNAVSPDGTTLTVTVPSQYQISVGTVMKIYVENDEFGLSDEDPDYLNNPKTFTVTGPTSQSETGTSSASIFDAVKRILGL